MVAFNTATFDIGNDYQLIELDSTGEGGQFEKFITIDKKASLVSILVEGEFIESDIRINDETLLDDRETSFVVESDNRRLCTKINPSHGIGQLLIHGMLKKGVRAKISVLVFFRRMHKFMSPISCTGCKRLIRFLISAMITGMGIPDIPLDGEIPQKFWQLFEEMEPPPAVVKILEHIPPDLFKGLRWFAGIVNEAFAPLDSVLIRICQFLGFCGRTA